MLDGTQRTTAAELLWAAERDLTPADPLTETFPGALGNPTACAARLARKMADFDDGFDQG
jgi:hypothetical protein